MAETQESGVGLPADGAGKTVATLEIPFRSADGTTQYKEIQLIALVNEQGDVIQLSEVQNILKNIEMHLEKIAFLTEVRAK